MVASDLDYWSHRAEREAVAAAAADDQMVAAIHEQLSQLYAEQVIRGLAQPPGAKTATRR